MWLKCDYLLIMWPKSQLIPTRTIVLCLTPLLLPSKLSFLLPLTIDLFRRTQPSCPEVRRRHLPPPVRGQKLVITTSFTLSRLKPHKRNNSRSNFKLLYLFFISLWLISNYFRNKNISFPNLISPNSVTHPDLYFNLVILNNCFSFYFTKLIKILSFLYWKRNEQSTNYMPFGFRCLCYWWWIVNINCREGRWTKLWVVENW